jgi:LysM repeat protein
MMSLAACRLSPAQTPEVQATATAPFTIVTQAPIVEETAEVIGGDDNDADTGGSSTSGSSSSSSSSSSSGSGSSTGTTKAGNNYVPPCYPRTDWPYVYTVVRGDTLSIIARRTATTVSTLVAANCLKNANIISVGQKIYVPNQPVYQTSLTFSTISPTISRSYLQTSNPIFNVSWTITDRPPNSNLRFEQLLPNGTFINVELPRNEPYVASEGNGFVRLYNPGNVNQIVLYMTLYNTVNGVTLAYREMVIQILDLPPSPVAPTPTYVPTPVPPPYVCYGINTSPTTVYAGFQGTGVPAVGTIPANTIIEVLTREFNGYLGVRFYWQSLYGPQDIGWVAPNLPMYGNCANLPDIYQYTGHGSGIDDGVTCIFVADTVVAIYTTPLIAGTILASIQPQQIYLFNAYGDIWISGDVSGYWIEISYNLQTGQKGYIQNTGGHLQGTNCPTSPS